ncbi:MAG: MFS transporter [Candidatus Hydrogenedentes bacterium]|nr:MFS transporter [Candidatus Hydrogenedentota bacterium]
MLIRYLNHLWTELSDAGRKTFPWDLVRGAASGAVSTVQMVFALLIAINYFHATDIQKSLIAGSIFGGLILSMPYEAWSVVLLRKTVRGAVPLFAAAAGLTVAALAPNAAVYTAGIVAYGLCAALAIPIMTGIYRDNYRGHVRGQVYGITLLVMVGVGLVAQSVGGGLLETDLGMYRPLFLGFAVLSVLSGIAVLGMPDRIERVKPTINPFASLSTVFENPMFAYMLSAWFLFGFANLALQPQRIEYVSQARYGFEMSPGMIVLIVGITTDLTRLLVIPVWARLFDRYHFVPIRIAMSSLLMIYAILYYNFQSVVTLVLGSISLGAALGGGALAWQLWVTKYAPPDQTARYMSVHTFFTGLRGSVGPAIGYICVEHLSIQTTSRLCALLVAISLAMLWRIRDKALRV